MTFASLRRSRKFGGRFASLTHVTDEATQCWHFRFRTLPIEQELCKHTLQTRAGFGDGVRVLLVFVSAERFVRDLDQVLSRPGAVLVNMASYR